MPPLPKKENLSSVKCCPRDNLFQEVFLKISHLHQLTYTLEILASKVEHKESSNLLLGCFLKVFYFCHLSMVLSRLSSCSSQQKSDMSWPSMTQDGNNLTKGESSRHVNQGTGSIGRCASAQWAPRKVLCLISHEEISIKSTVSYHFTPRMAAITEITVTAG